MFEFIESCKTIEELENILKEKNYDWKVTDFQLDDEFGYYTYRISVEVDEDHDAVRIYRFKTKSYEEIVKRNKII